MAAATYEQHLTVRCCDRLLRSMSDDAMAHIPMRRSGTAEEIAKAVLFLASDEAAYISGIELTVDRGWTQA